jgi:hypothetical protein
MSRLLFGANSAGEIFQFGPLNTDENVTAVCLRALTTYWAPNGWTDEALWRIATVIISSNVGGTFQLTPIVDQITLDGTGGEPDCRVTYVVETPSAGIRKQIRTLVGLFRPVNVGTFSGMRVGLRGTFLQFLVETVGEITIPVGETNPDIRFEGVEVETESLGGTKQVVNAL